MIYSMTGFGRAEATTDNKKLTVEIKSLNSKQLDMQLRFPACYRELEISLRTTLSQKLQRGKVEAVAAVESLEGTTHGKFNIEALKAYKDSILNASNVLGISEPNDWFPLLLRLPDVMTNKECDPAALEKEQKALAQAVEEATEALIDFRKREGMKLESFFREKIANISQYLIDLEPFEKERVPAIRKKLEEQLAGLAVDYDRDRLEQELIFYIEKLDVTEEKTRLKAHMEYFLNILALPEGGQGKKLGFIAQEMGREINTLGSKSNNAQMQQIVVHMKDELEQIKEQVLNVL